MHVYGVQSTVTGVTHADIGVNESASISARTTLDLTPDTDHSIRRGWDEC